MTISDSEKGREAASVGQASRGNKGSASHPLPNFEESEFHNKAEGFDAPVKHPRDDLQRRHWQAANRAWWERTPMRYDWREPLTDEPGTPGYFREIDRRFFDSARGYTSWHDIPFERIIPFDSLGDKDVLEIGVGHGTHAQLLAERCKSFTGIDLTARAVEMTAQRFRHLHLDGRILEMDAEEMRFPDASFDYIWSWGVVHHSADTRRVLEHMHRVLRPGGRATVMVYFRSWWQFYVCGWLRRAFQPQFSDKADLHAVAQHATDGAIARYYSFDEWRDTTRGLFTIERMRACGLAAELVPLPHGRLKTALEAVLPGPATRFMTSNLRMGSFLLADMSRT